jgi:hypothetical protein
VQRQRSLSFNQQRGSLRPPVSFISRAIPIGNKQADLGCSFHQTLLFARFHVFATNLIFFWKSEPSPLQRNGTHVYM